jgi:RimJ/RimL family protein N-acetyltransferase
MTLETVKSSKLVLARFDEQFLEKSWQWLRDPEIRALTMSPEFTREQQLAWFASLSQKTDYLIWGLSCDGTLIGAAGLKHVTKDSAEYWGYIGERQFWGLCLGRQTVDFLVAEARKLGLREIYLNVHQDNARAMALYAKCGFTDAGRNGDVLKMRMILREDENSSSPALTVERYCPDRKVEWDTFLASAKNATFLFNRDYIDYNLKKFPDHSFMVFAGQKPVALLPASRKADGTLVSHPGLTYGGLVVNRAATLGETLAYFYALLRHLHEQGIEKVLYKQIPSFYNTLPDDEAAYALFLVDAHLCRRDCALTIPLTPERLPFQSRRKRQVKRAAQANVRFVRETDFTPFWTRVLTPRLEGRYGTKPVHTVEEITLLASRFPDNIKQFSAYHGDEIVAGITIYETPTVAHAQYISMTDEAAKLGALDGLVAWLIEQQYPHKRNFDFGISNEKEGRALNHGLLEWKEGFGGRSCAHDFYEVATANHTKLEPVLPGENGRENSPQSES